MKFVNILTNTADDIRRAVEARRKEAIREIDMTDQVETVIAKAVQNPVDDNWREQARLLVAQHASGGHPFTSDDIMLKLEDEGLEAAEPRALGAIFRDFSKRGVITRVGYVQSVRPSRHKAPIAQWQGS